MTEVAGFFPKQKMAHEAAKHYKYILYGGGMGGGKSRWLRWEMVLMLHRLWKLSDVKSGIMGALFCEDYPSLKDRQISKMDFPEWMGTYCPDHKLYGNSYVLCPELGSGVLAFRNLDDPKKYDSSEYAIIGIDEAQKNTFETFRILRRRNRWKGINDCKMLLTANPGGNSWVKDLWIDRIFSENENEKDQFYFIQSLIDDNPYLDESYKSKLQSMTDSEKKAYLMGDWNAFESEIDEKGYMRIADDAILQNAEMADIMHIGAYILGVDPAAGGDKSTIVLKSDTAAEVLFNQKLEDTMALVKLIVQYANEYEAKGITIDVTGIGNGVADRLEEIKRKVGMYAEIFRVSFAENASDSIMFSNKKAEIYWSAVQWMKNGGKVKKDECWNEWKIIRYKKQSDDAIVIESKSELRKHGIESPNAVDALSLCFAVDSSSFMRYARIRSSNFYDKSVELWRQ
ncbi:MAG: phage terminase large subunit [Patescibacteria group bacterium]|nr:phage terminase large subunit [Patescibacteria group bacterium]MDE2439126.1 phage terminase large subunit [Patescibacteria group bacterium]